MLLCFCLRLEKLDEILSSLKKTRGEIERINVDGKAM